MNPAKNHRQISVIICYTVHRNIGSYLYYVHNGVFRACGRPAARSPGPGSPSRTWSTPPKSDGRWWTDASSIFFFRRPHLPGSPTSVPLPCTLMTGRVKVDGKASAKSPKRRTVRALCAWWELYETSSMWHGMCGSVFFCDVALESQEGRHGRHELMD